MLPPCADLTHEAQRSADRHLSWVEVPIRSPPPPVEGLDAPPYCRSVIRQTLSTAEAAPTSLVSLARAGFAGLRLAELRVPAALVPPGQLVLPHAGPLPRRTSARRSTSATA